MFGFMKVLVFFMVLSFGCIEQFQTLNAHASNNPPTKEEKRQLDDPRHVSERPETKTKLKRQKPPAANSRNIHVQLLGINDFHGHLNEARIVNGRKAGRADYLAAYLKQREAQNKNTLLVHAGDMVGASPPISALLQDEPTIEFLNKLGFDIGTVGNHEFDEGMNELLRLIHGGYHPKTGFFAGSRFPWIAANVIDVKTGKPILAPYKIIQVNGLPIGFIGVVTTKTQTMVRPDRISGVTFIDEVDAVNHYTAVLKRQGIRSIVVLAHNPGHSGPHGENPTGELVDMANRTDEEVDVIFGGHNHAYMNAVVHNKLLVEAYSYGTAFSDVELEIDPKTKNVVNKIAEIVTTYQDVIEPDPGISKMIKVYEEKTAPLMNRVVGTTTAALTAKQDENGESLLGNFMTDAQRKEMNSDFAVIATPGSIRADIDSGDITWGEIYAVQPFHNELVKLTFTGRQIREVLNQQWGTKNRMLQISGLQYKWDPAKPQGNRIASIKLPDGKDLDLDKEYTLTANIYLAEGGDQFTAFTKAKDREIGPTEVEALANYISSMPKPFTYSIQNRIQKLKYWVFGIKKFST